MELSVQDHFLNFVKLFVTQHVASNHALKDCVDPTIGELWANTPFSSISTSHVGFYANFCWPSRQSFWPSCPSFWP